MTRTLSALFAVVLLFDWSKTAADAHGHRAEGQASVGISYTQTGDPPLLVPHRSISSTLAVGEEQSYTMMLEKDQFLHIVVRQLRIKVDVTLLRPDGKLFDLAHLVGDEWAIAQHISVSGKYRLVVRGLARSDPNGRYEVKIEELLTPTAEVLKTRKSARELLNALNEQGRGVESGHGDIRTLRMIVRLLGAAGNYGQVLELDPFALADKEQPDQTRIAQALLNLGNDHRSFGDHSEALEAFRRSLAWSEAAGDKTGMVYALSGMGIVYQRQRNPALALDRLHKSLALALTEDVPSSRVSVVSSNLGVVYALQKNFGQALEFFQFSLRSLGDDVYRTKPPEQVAILFNNIGFAYSDLGDHDQALEYLQRSLSARNEQFDKAGFIQALNNIGSVYARQKDYGKALEYFRRSLATVRDKQAKADTLNNIAVTLLFQGNYAEALEFSGRALELARELALRHVLWEAHTTAGRAYDGLGQPEKAGLEFEKAIEVIESIRADIPDRESRTNFFASVRAPYDLYVDLLMRQHQRNSSPDREAKALEISEGSRARALLEVLSEARADIRRGSDTELLRRERLLQSQLNVKAEQQTRLLSGQHTPAEATTMKEGIETITAELGDVRRQIRLQSPRYASLTQPARLSITEIKALLDGDTLLLEYVLGDERSYLWAVTPTLVTSFRLPGREEIEQSAKAFYELLSDGENWVTTTNRTDANYAKEAERLSAILLGPVATQLKGKRLIIVGDGVLQYLPFGALRSPGSQTQRPLIADNEVVSLPSVSTLAMLRRDTRSQLSVSGSVAVIADPVFDANDERFAAAKNAGARPNSNAKGQYGATSFVRGLLERTRSARERAQGAALTISRLPFTRREADAILANAPGSKRLKAVDFDASRETATGPLLSKYRYVHFATHGVLDSQHPELSGIVLSLVDRTGKSTDGYLRLHEIFNLNLSADLVVLSGCQTALGRDIKGEGLIGLTRGFMYAGSPRVLASLWKVNDVATAELMARFYRGMLKEKLQPAAALRLAQVEMFNQKRWRSPYYWAAFQLQGDWK